MRFASTRLESSIRFASRLGLLALSLVVCAVAAKADTQTVTASYSFTIGFQVLNDKVPKLPKFDPSLGTLSGINLKMDWTTQAVGPANSIRGGGNNIIVTGTDKFTLSLPDSTAFLDKGNTVTQTSFIFFDTLAWVVDNKGTINGDVPANKFSLLTGTGTVDLPLKYLLTLSAKLQFTNEDLDWGFDHVSGTVKITAVYTYSQIQKQPAVATVQNARALIGRDIPLVGGLTVNGSVASGKTLAFKIDGVTVGSGVTDSNGTATVSFRVPQSLSVGDHILTSVFAGDTTTLSATSPNGIFTAQKGKTAVTVTAVTGRIANTIRLVAFLRNSGIGLLNRTLVFSVDGVTAGTVNTDANGRSVLNYTIPDNLSSTTPTISVAFAGDANFLASTGTNVLTVTKMDSTLFVPDRTIAKGRGGTLRARLNRADKQVVAGRTVTFTLNGVAVGSGVTDATGGVFVNIVAPATAGTYPIVATFAGDNAYNSSTASGMLTVN